tara:strand:+ start:735 stop:932 length:198 start_codon:yes stop_codon:yes gene_type:complete
MKYKIKHEQGQDYWIVYFGDTWVERFRAKSRSKAEIQRLIDHMNQQLNRSNTMKIKAAIKQEVAK